METHHQELTQSFHSANGENNEIRIAIVPIDQKNVKKMIYEASNIGSIQSLKTPIQEDSNIIRRVLIISSSNVESSLHMSILHGHLEFTRLLVDLKPELLVEVDAPQPTPLHLASANGEVEIVQALLEKNTSACLVRDFNGLIPLHHAVIHGQIEIIQELVNARPQSIWVKLQNGQTILHLCAKHNHLEAIKLLTKLILKIHDDEEFFNAVDDNGNTILDLSLMLRQVKMVQYLLSIRGIKTGTSKVNIYAGSNAVENRSCPSSYTVEDVPHIRVENSEGSKTLARPRELIRCWKKHLQYKGDWLQEVQGTMMLVATVIATVTFQGAINPPGGIWQEDIPFHPNTNIQRLFYGNNNLTTTLIAGTAVMAYPTLDQGSSYNHYLIANSISFLASICVIIFIIGRLPLKNKICAWLLTITMCTAVASLAYSYIVGIWIVNNFFKNSLTLRVTSKIAVFIWLGMVGVVVLCNIIFPFLVWMVRLLIWVKRRPLLPV